jgi:ATP/maltotriose-dependent transcriptional regulator MalT
LPDLLTVAVDDLLREGRTQTVVQWLDLAEANHLTSPVIDLAASEIGFREGHYAKAEALALAAVRQLEDPELRARALIRAGQSAMLDSRDEQALPLFREARRCGQTQYARLEALVGEYLTSLELGRAADAEDAFAELTVLDEGGFDTKIRQATVHLVRAARLGGVDAALEVAAEVRPLLANLKDPLIATSFLNTTAHVLVLSGRYEEALEVGQAELELAQRYRLDFALPHALLVSAAALTGLREFAKAIEQIEAAETQAQSHDVHIAAYTVGLRARIAIHRHKFEEALVHTAERWERPASHPARAELLAYRGLAAACLGDATESEARCTEVRELASSGIEAAALTACALAILALSEDPSNSGVAADAFRQVEATGAVDSFITAARGSSRFLAAVLEALDDTTPVVRALSESNDFRLAREAGLILEGSRRGPTRELTQRELEVAHLVTRGYTNRMIAQALFISDSTVKVHVRHILDKLGARSRAELAARIASGD